MGEHEEVDIRPAKPFGSFPIPHLRVASGPDPELARLQRDNEELRGLLARFACTAHGDGPPKSHYCSVCGKPMSYKASEAPLTYAELQRDLRHLLTALNVAPDAPYDQGVRLAYGIASGILADLATAKAEVERLGQENDDFRRQHNDAAIEIYNLRTTLVETKAELATAREEERGFIEAIHTILEATADFLDTIEFPVQAEKLRHAWRDAAHRSWGAR